MPVTASQTKASLVFLTLTLAAVAAETAERQDAVEPSVRFGERVDVGIAELDVTVTDNEGAPVLDLTPEDFLIVEDGQPVEITNFALVRHRGTGSHDTQPTAHAGTENVSAGQHEIPVRLVLFIDSVHTGPASRARFLQNLWNLVRDRLTADDEVMVVSYDGAIRVHAEPTSDRAAIGRVLEMIGGSLAPGAGTDTDLHFAIQQIRQRQRAAIESPWEAPCPKDLEWLARDYAAQERQQAEAALAAAREFVDSLAGLNGQWAVLHVSDGLPMQAGMGAFEFVISLCDGTGAAQGVEDAFDVNALSPADRAGAVNVPALRMEQAEHLITDALREVATHAATNRVRFYTLQGLAPDLSVTAAFAGKSFTAQGAAAIRHNVEDALVFLARESGGMSMLRSPNFARDIERVLDTLSATYSIAYAAPSSTPGSEHEIRVEIDRSDVRAHYARQRRTPEPDERVVDRLLSKLLYGAGPNPIGVELSVGDTSSRVRVSVPVSGLGLVPLGEQLHGTFTVFLTAGHRESGRVLAVRQKTIPVFVTPDEIPPAYITEIDMDTDLAGLDVVVAVRDDLAGRVSFERHRSDG